MALRKLQAEIDKTLKAVALGVETFEATFDKLNHASNSTQKDKVENDLKTQIKKLQRMRDQIKAWIGSSDIKDKSALLDNRKLIETQMERFKALEKEMKMKAFSKEGLIAQSKLDPAEKAKRDMIEWVVNTTDELSRQVEATEAEIEGMTTMKKKKSGVERTAELEELNERRQWHIGRLEIIQRMLENGQLPADQVESIQEDIKYFVESNTDEDFDYDQGLYDDLNLLDEEDFNGEFTHPDEQSLDSASLADDIPPPISAPSPSAATIAGPKTPAKEEKEKRNTPVSKAGKEKEKRDDSALADEAGPSSPVLSKKATSRKSTMDSSKAELPRLGAKTDVPPVPPVPVTITAVGAQPKAPLPPIRYAAAAAAAVASTAPSLSTQAVQSPTENNILSPLRQRVELPVESPAQEKEEPVPQQLNGQQSQAAPPGLTPAETASGPLSPQTPDPIVPSTSTSIPPEETFAEPASQPGIPPSANGPSTIASSTLLEATAIPADQTNARPSSQQQGVLGSLMQSFDVAKELSQRRGDDVSQLHRALEVSYQNAPHQADSDPPRYYMPKNPVKTPSHYPQTRGTVLLDKSVYDRFDVDQLFFIFYYYSGSYEQYLAAQRLKQLNWRFHKQYLTWFKRAHNPQAITEDYEQGGYFYFDWENSWCQRKKSDFRFEYRWLSEN